MRIVKPYGRSEVARENGKPPRRLLRLRDSSEKSANSSPVEITDYAARHDELVIAQWISVIDTIIAKPRPKERPSKEQRQLRLELGDACWALMEKEGLLPGLVQGGERAARLRKIWNARISPYGPGDWQPGKDKNGRQKKKPRLEGRWYKRFLGETSGEAIAMDTLAGEIFDHLYTAEQRIRGGFIREEKRTIAPNCQGRIQARAESIAKNVLAHKPAAYGGGRGSGWADSDEQDYRDKGEDVAARIKQAVETYEDFENKAGRECNDYLRQHGNEPPLRPLHAAAAILRAKYRALFPSGDGALTMKQARESHPGLFTLHRAVKDCYTRIFKQRRDRKSQQGLSRILPGNCEELFRLVECKGNNRDLNRLVRLGKIIHYQESAGRDYDSPAHVRSSLPDKKAIEIHRKAIKNSDWWTSDGQARIKRNEALVRIWRHVLALANRALTDWADPKGIVAREKGDVIGGDPAIKLAVKEFDDAHHRARMKVLFGNRNGLFSNWNDADFNRDVMEFALRSTQSLRHTSFHFKGLAEFVGALRALQEVELKGIGANSCPVPPSLRQALKSLWREDCQARAVRIRESMDGADFGYFFDEAQNRKLLRLLVLEGGGDLPLPRFGRMMQRVTDAWKGKDRLPLPERPNRNQMEASPARRCQYVALKMVYEGPFRRWLDDLEGPSLKAFIDRAVGRTTAAAKNINGKRDGNDPELVVARAARLQDAPDVTGMRLDQPAPAGRGGRT